MNSYDKHKSQVEAARKGDGKFGTYSAGSRPPPSPPAGEKQGR